MTANQIIACVISWTAALVAIAALIRIRHARRQPVRWEIDGGVITFDRRLTEAEIEQFKTEWKRRYGRPAKEAPDA